MFFPLFSFKSCCVIVWQFCFCCIFACVLYLILVFEQFCFCRYSLYLFVFYCSSFCLRLTHFASLLLIACFNFLLASSSSLSWPTVTCKICIKIKIWSPVLSNSLYYVTFCLCALSWGKQWSWWRAGASQHWVCTNRCSLSHLTRLYLVLHY